MRYRSWEARETRGSEGVCGCSVLTRLERTTKGAGSCVRQVGGNGVAERGTPRERPPQRRARHRARWWLVGAAWAGHGDRDDAEGVTAARPLRGKEDDGAQQALLAAARAQGMNTEARRNIFVVLMSSEDYADASNRLLSLKLNDTQRREIVRVLLHCVSGVSCASVMARKCIG